MLCIDAHVHLHTCFDIQEVFYAAWHNVTIAAREAGKGFHSLPVGVLMLTESDANMAFTDLLQVGSGLGGWRILTTHEPECMWACGQQGERLLLIDGQQIQTAEGLEILALGTGVRWPAGLPLPRLVPAIRAASALPVVPWGFGKWLGPRGKVITKLIQEHRKAAFHLGDNGGRSRLIPYPIHFKSAGRRGIRILPGSDPLPFAKDYRRIGAFGALLKRPLSFTTPGIQLKRYIDDADVPLEPYGDLTHPVQFLHHQVAMQLRKRF